MRRLRVTSVFAPLALLLAGAWTAEARPLGEAERLALQARVASFEAAMLAKDFATVADVTPPRLVDFFAKQAGKDVEATRADMIAAMTKRMGEAELITFDLDPKAAQELEMTDGTPVVLVPTEVVVRTDAGTTRSDSLTLGLIDDGHWYFVRGSEKSLLGLIIQLYPELAGIAIPTGTTTTVEEAKP